MPTLEDLMTDTLAALRVERAVKTVGEWEELRHAERLSVLEARLDRQLLSYRRIHSTPKVSHA